MTKKSFPDCQWCARRLRVGRRAPAPRGRRPRWRALEPTRLWTATPTLLMMCTARQPVFPRNAVRNLPSSLVSGAFDCFATLSMPAGALYVGCSSGDDAHTAP